MNPTWTSRSGRAASASSTRRQASVSSASGFSQITGLPAAMQARVYSSCVKPGDATITASTSSSPIRSCPSGWTRAPPAASATRFACSTSTSETATTCAFETLVARRWRWYRPMVPVPTTPILSAMASTPCEVCRVWSAGTGGADAAPLEVAAGADGDGQRDVGGAGVQVLLDDHEQLDVEVVERVQDRPDLRDAARGLAHHAPADRLGERQALRPDLLQDRRVGLLHVEVADAVGVLADQLDVVAGVVGDMGGVEAQRDRLRVGVLEEALDLGLGSHVAVGVGMEDGGDAVLLGEDPAELRGGEHQRPPCVAVELGGLEEVALEVRVQVRQQDDVPGAHRADQLGHATRVLQVRGPLLRVVQAAEHRLPGDLEPTPLQLVAQPGRVGWQVGVGAELEPSVAGLRELVEEAGPGRLRRVVGEPHPPRVRATAEPQP